MILYRNSLMQLNFDPANSLMEVNWPNFESYSLDDTKLALSRLVSTVKTYEVKKLLVDATNAKLTVESETYEEIVKHFTHLLFETGLEMVARVMTTDPDRESMAKKMAKFLPASIRLQHFNTIAEAKDWLLNPSA